MTKITREYKINADEMFQKVREICDKQGFSTLEEDAVNRHLTTSTDWSAFSWGEVINIIVSQQAEGSTVTAESKPKVWFNLPARDRAERNVKRLFEELDKK